MSATLVNTIVSDSGVSESVGSIAHLAYAQYVTRLLNREINNFLGIKSKQRGELSSERAERALDELAKLGDRVRDRIVEALDGGSDEVAQVLKHVSVPAAGAKRICHRNRNRHSIAKDKLFLHVKDGQGGYKNFCAECAEPVLDKAQEDLDLLRAQLHL